MSPAPPAQYDYDKRHTVLGIVTVFLVYGTMAYSIQALNVARPRIAAELGGMSIYAWSVSIPGLFGAFATLLFGELSDIYGLSTTYGFFTPMLQKSEGSRTKATRVKLSRQRDRDPLATPDLESSGFPEG